MNVTRLLEIGDQWVYDVVTSTRTLLGKTVQTAVDTQDVVQVRFKGQDHLAIRSRLRKNLVGGGSQLVTSYRVFTQDNINRTVRMIGQITESGAQVSTSTSTMLPGNVTLTSTWNTVSNLLTSILTTSYNVTASGSVDVASGAYAGFKFSASQLAIPNLSLDLLYSSEGWLSGPIGNMLKEKRVSVGVTQTKEVEIELTSTNVD